jgi:hypothetical protein
MASTPEMASGEMTNGVGVGGKGVGVGVGDDAGAHPTMSIKTPLMIQKILCFHMIQSPFCDKTTTVFPTMIIQLSKTFLQRKK